MQQRPDQVQKTAMDEMGRGKREPATTNEILAKIDIYERPDDDREPKNRTANGPESRLWATRWAIMKRDRHKSDASVQGRGGAIPADNDAGGHGTPAGNPSRHWTLRLRLHSPAKACVSAAPADARPMGCSAGQGVSPLPWRNLPNRTPSTMREGWSYRSPAPISRSGYIKEWDITPSEKSTFLERLFSQARQLYTGISPQAHARPPSRPRITGDTGGRPYSTPSSAPYATRLPLALTRSSRSSGYF
ncbi:hypothetical protein EDB85DRAFT_1893192 [Lactarius pseudohatsudake]|nr:hypothetical protein EDB85DRAFT_1893192 [Lactarius pseudohatsudake]